MNDKFPEYLNKGEAARLFPVLATSSKEGRATSIFLACLSKVDELAEFLFSDLKQRVGKRTKVRSYTEIVMKKNPKDVSGQPDGLIVLSTGNKEWRALVEAKIGPNKLEDDQIERYRNIAKENGIDCIITISNEFTTTPFTHPLEKTRKSRLKLPVYHWSWMYILTTVELLLTQETVSDIDQRVLLNEFRRFLTHESTGVKGFDRMPKEWNDLNKHVSSGGSVSAKAEEASIVLEAWHQETRDLSLILTRMIEVNVEERLSRKHKNDLALRFAEELNTLKENSQLQVTLDIPDAVAPLEVIANLAGRRIDVGMSLRAPGDKKTTKARVNWILKQIKTDKIGDLYLRLFWPGKSEATQYAISDLIANLDVSSKGREHLVVNSFYIFSSRYLGGRFTQQANFISDLESVVPEFYINVGANLVAWKQQAPKIKGDKLVAEDVSTESISEDAEDYKASK